MELSEHTLDQQIDFIRQKSDNYWHLPYEAILASLRELQAIKSSSGLPPKPAKLSADTLNVGDDWYFSEDAYDKLEAAALKLAEQNEALRKDAERYRWILTQAAITDFVFKHTKSSDRHVSSTIDDELAARKELK